MLTVEPLALPDVLLLRPKVFADLRGAFAELFRADELEKLGLPPFVQENQAITIKQNTVRGLHFQKPPAAQAKLIQVQRGKLLDVAVDMRPTSPTFGQHIAVTLSGDDWSLLYIPVGFAHGYCTLSDDVTMTYKVSHTYAPEIEGGILWNDPALGIQWPVQASDALLIDKDKQWPRLSDLSPIVW